MFQASRLPSCSGFTLTSVNEYLALLYGGHDGEHDCPSSDLYLIDFKTMVRRVFVHHKLINNVI